MRRFAKITALMLILIFCLTGCGGTKESKHTLEITETKFEDVNGHSCFVMYTDYTNNSDHSALPCDVKQVKVFQNGIQIFPIVFTGNKFGEYITCDTEVQSGYSAKVIWMYQTEDKENEVKVEIYDIE